MKVKTQKSLPCRENSRTWNEKTLQGTIKLGFLTMFISVESLSPSLNGSQIVSLHYDDILQVGVLVVGSDAGEHRYGIKQLKGKPQLAPHSIWGCRTHVQPFGRVSHERWKAASRLSPYQLQPATHLHITRLFSRCQPGVTLQDASTQTIPGYVF